ncbi:MAG: PKD domain-containing protein, partial [Bacteroidetes bacterium]
PAPPNPQAPNPLYDGANCTQEFLTFRDLLARTNADPQLAVATNPCDPAQPIPPELRPMVETLPALTWSNKNWNKPARAFVPIFKETDGRPTGVEIIDPRSPIEGDNFEGFSSLGGVVYTAESFPPEYRGKYFHFDFSGWIQIFHFDEQHRLVAVEPFHRNPKDLIHLALNPRDGCLYYIRLTGGQIRKICYGGNPPPVAVIEHSQNFGGSTLEVQFDASKSYDPNGLPLSYHWDFGDGNTSTLPAPTHTFSTSGTAPRSFRVTLTVTDSLGAADSSFAIVSLNNTPPQVTITSFEDGDRYPLDGPSVLALQAHVEDAEHPREQLHWRWQAFLHHNDHYHPDPPLETPAAYAFISPLGCEEETYWYRIELTVTDPEGLATTVTQNIYPNCDGAFTALNLTGESFEDHLRLSWSSADESGVRQYLLQRSADGLHFETLRTFPALGVPSTYAFEDRSPLLGSNIYRVKALGPDGAYQYSNWLTLSFPPEPDLRVFPNPVRQTANFHLREAFDERVRIRLFDPQGATLLDRSFEAQPGERFEQSLLLPHLGNGLYFYLLENGAFRKGGSIVVLKG